MCCIHNFFVCVVGKRESPLEGLRKCSREGDVKPSGASSCTFVTICHATAIRAIHSPRVYTLAMSSSTGNNTPVDIMNIDDDTQSEL